MAFLVPGGQALKLETRFAAVELKQHYPHLYRKSTGGNFISTLSRRHRGCRRVLFSQSSLKESGHLAGWRERSQVGVSTPRIKTQAVIPRHSPARPHSRWRPSLAIAPPQTRVAPSPNTLHGDIMTSSEHHGGDQRHQRSPSHNIPCPVSHSILRKTSSTADHELASDTTEFTLTSSTY